MDDKDDALIWIEAAEFNPRHDLSANLEIFIKKGEVIAMLKQSLQRVTTTVLALFMTASSAFSFTVPVCGQEMTTVVAKRKKEGELSSTGSLISKIEGGSGIDSEKAEINVKLEVTVEKHKGGKRKLMNRKGKKIFLVLLLGISKKKRKKKIKKLKKKIKKLKKKVKKLFKYRI